MAKDCKKDRNYIELFAGCGGMSLGLESAGFRRLFANEISPMAAETFAFNLVKGARKAGELDPGSPSSWEGHFTFIDPPDRGADWKSFRDWRKRARKRLSKSQAAGSVIMDGAGSNLLVGDVGRLRKLLEKLKSDPKFKERFGLGPSGSHGSVDLIAGGPPCQSFSIAGKREKDNARNQLFREFVRIVEIIRPKVVLFENVQGIMRPFVDELGHKWHPWHEVCRRFLQAGYLPIPSLVNAADFGIPQSRPRFIMVAVHKDIAKLAEERKVGGAGLVEAFMRARNCYRKEGDDTRLIFKPGPSPADSLWPTPLLPEASNQDSQAKVSVESAIGDLLSIGNWEGREEFRSSRYADMLESELPWPGPKKDKRSFPLNHKPRKHCPRTKVRFRLLRELSELGFKAKNMSEVTNNKADVAQKLVGRELLFPEGEGTALRKVKDVGEALDLINFLASSKNVQRCLIRDEPAGAQLSIPDDYVHWGDDRVLTIREMARIQSFPDWFELRSKETTGGSARAYEVPQYTQVGNAVPPLLAKAFGASISDFLRCLGH